MFDKFYITIDTHTEGDPTRFLLFGTPFLKGNTMVERVQEFQNKYDYVRKLLLQEPRGHKDMFGAIITPPVTDEAAMGVIFMDNDGYMNMCGHGIMAAATIGKKFGFVNKENKEVIIDTAAGVVKARYLPSTSNKNEFSVEITSVPSFAYKLNEKINIDTVGKVNVDIGFGGNFFAFVKASDLGLDERNLNLDEVRELGMTIKNAVNKSIKIQHPELYHINTCDLVEILFKPSSPNINCKNVLVYGEGQIGRDPCGTGTTAKMAIEYAKGNLDLGESYVKEGIIGTTYTGKIIDEKKVGNIIGVIPVISGSTYITGIHQFVIEDNEPRKTGWLL